MNNGGRRRPSAASAVIAASILCWIPTGIALWVLVMWIGWPALLAAVVGVYFAVALIGIVKANT